MGVEWREPAPRTGFYPSRRRCPAVGLMRRGSDGAWGDAPTDRQAPCRSSRSARSVRHASRVRWRFTQRITSILEMPSRVRRSAQTLRHPCRHGLGRLAGVPAPRRLSGREHVSMPVTGSYPACCEARASTARAHQVSCQSSRPQPAVTARLPDAPRLHELGSPLAVPKGDLGLTEALLAAVSLLAMICVLAPWVREARPQGGPISVVQPAAWGETTGAMG